MSVCECVSGRVSVCECEGPLAAWGRPGQVWSSCRVLREHVTLKCWEGPSICLTLWPPHPETGGQAQSSLHPHGSLSAWWLTDLLRGSFLRSPPRGSGCTVLTCVVQGSQRLLYPEPPRQLSKILCPHLTPQPINQGLGVGPASHFVPG